MILEKNIPRLRPTLRPTYSKIDLGVLGSNYLILKNAVASGQIVCPMVKANAYGHGDAPVAQKLRSLGASHLGVALVEEGLRLRESGDAGAILHFGMFDRFAAEMMLENEITPVLSSISDFETILDLKKKSGSSKPLAIHLEVNTGMNRLGVSLQDVAGFAKRLVASKSEIRLEGVCTHFSDGEDFGVREGRSEEQMRVFREADRILRQAGLEGYRLHVANSFATAAIATLRKNGQTGSDDLGTRPGISLYGIEPEQKIGVRPVMELRSQIVHLQSVPRGGRVSYGGRWQAPRDSRIGIVPCGYADGFRRGLSSPGGASSVLIGGKRAPIVGTICMDYFMCDLTEVEAAKLGSDVVLMGTVGPLSILAEDLASTVQTIPYEILTGISDRVPRVYVDDTASMGVLS